MRTGGNTRGEKVLVVFVRLLECEMQNKFLCMQTEKYNVNEKIGYWRWWRRACVPSLTLQIKYTLLPPNPHPQLFCVQQPGGKEHFRMYSCINQTHL